MGVERQIPEDLRKQYERVKGSHPSMGWLWTLPLFERIADLAAEVERHSEALRLVEWIMVNGRIQCPACLHSKDEGHGVLCQIDEVLHSTAEKQRLRAEQNALYQQLQPKGEHKEGL